MKEDDKKGIDRDKNGGGKDEIGRRAFQGRSS
jgi:hypothetical protein